ncbi:MAG: ABC transporter substrate-binding protein [Candidatus Wallbacteria bacterium]|nr:ABC transporter substrate-binding protein [Candidatus Wallbacteria bacterium]
MISSRTVLVFLVGLLLSTGCGGPPTGPAPDAGVGGGTGGGSAAAGAIVLGVAGPMTGDLAQVGKMMERGAKMRVDEVNARGGIGGRKVELEVGDDTGNPKEASTVAQKFASNPAVMAVVGHYNSSCSLAGKPIYKEAGLVEFSSGSTNPTVCEGSDWTFRNIYRDDFQGQMLARYAKQHMGAARVAVFYDNDDYGIGLKTAFEEEAKKIALEVVAAQSYERDTVDFRPQLSTFMAKRPDIILVSGLFSQAAKIASQARESGLAVPLLGGDGVFSDEYIKNAGAAAENTYVSTPFLFELGGERARAWHGEFKKAFGTEPDAWAVLAYDAAALLLQGVEKGGATRKAVRDYIAAIDSKEKAFAGLGGATYFDKNGDCLKPVHMALVKGGKFVPAPKQMN